MAARFGSVDLIEDEEQGGSSHGSVYAEENARKADDAEVVDEASVRQCGVLKPSLAGRGSAQSGMNTSHPVPQKGLR